MTTIFKYDLPYEFGAFTLPLPVGADTLDVSNQYDTGALWCVVDPSAKIEQRDFQLVETGGNVPKNGEYLGTYATLGGQRVYHLFELV